MAAFAKITTLLGSLALICLVVACLTSASPVYEASAQEDTKPASETASAGQSEAGESSNEQHGVDEQQEAKFKVPKIPGGAGTAVGVGLPLVSGAIKAGQCVAQKGFKNCIKGQSDSEHAEGHAEAAGGEHAEGE